MKIKILGTRGEIKVSAPYHSRKSGVLIDDHILLDVGDESFLEYKLKYILITHLHPDHAYFTRFGETPKLSAQIYAPENYDKMDIHVKTTPFTIEDYKITPIPTIHSIKVKSQAYLIEHGNKKILYTGDMIWIEKQYHELLHDIDMVITEASYIRTGGMVRKDPNTQAIFGHTGVPNLIHLFKQCTNTIVLVHFGSWFYKDIEKSHAEFAQLAKENDIKIIAGYDGLEITV
jgi:ribonuclease BN (tRNA processing enzyme)